jgi:hypothetical protein
VSGDLDLDYRPDPRIGIADLTHYPNTVEWCLTAPPMKAALFMAQNTNNDLFRPASLNRKRS